MKRLVLAAALIALIALSGCSLQTTKVITIPGSTQTVIVHAHQALDWNVEWSFYAASNVRLSYPLCPGQHLVGPPAVTSNGQNVSITLWATEATCANPDTRTITVQLGQPLGHRALTNPALLH